MFEVGDVVGSYTILAPLRSGGMADLFLARREGAAGFRRLVAIKVIHPRHAGDDHVVRMFLDEALISARVDHPNVVHVEDLGQVDGTYFLVMEYVHGQSLAQLMRRLGTLRRRFSPTVAVAIAARVAEGLHAAHETTDDAGHLVQLVHRDVSPQNILLSHKGHVKLIDFGVAKAALRSEQTNVATLKGKVRYMPPEQATTGRVDRRSDVYSLGIVLWEMLTMRRLFTGKTEFEVLLKVREPEIVPPSRYVSDISPALDRVVLAALSRDPAERPQSAKLFRRLLARAEPRSTTLDSAHLADLMGSVAGGELQASRHHLPEEVSRLLEAEQIRAALAAESETADQEHTESVIDVMTLHSDMILFEEDELDDTPAPDTSLSQSRPRDPEAPTEPIPGGAVRALRARSAETSVLSSDEAQAMQVPTLEDADPTVVGGAPRSLRAPALSVPEIITHDEDSEDLTTYPRPEAMGERASLPPIVAPALVGPPAPIVGETASMPRGRSVGWIALGLAVIVSALFGIALALAWPLLASDDEPEPEDAGPSVGARASSEAILVEAPPAPVVEPETAAEAVPVTPVVDAGVPAAPTRRRRRRARRYWRRR